MTSTGKATRTARADSYGKSSRFYELSDGTKLPSVTTILTAVNKPALIPWAAKMERNLVMEAAANLYEDAPASPKMTRAAFLASLTDRIGKQKAHTRELEKASQVGSMLHELIEWNLRRELGQAVGPEPRISDAAMWAFMVYEDWRKSVNMKPVLIEQTIWSRQFGYAGTLDFVAEIDHDGRRQRIVGDWKTGKAIYDEAILQNAAYTYALLEMGHGGTIDGGLIVRLPKVESDPKPETRFVTLMEQQDAFAAFLTVLKLWGWMDKRAQDKKGGDE